jgi:tripartite-type tricarboxylate transporter receptor subunit TctC
MEESMQRREFLMLTAALSAAGFATPANAAEYPKNKPILLVVPFPPGAGNDLLGRLTAEQLTKRIGQQVVVENKAGAGSAIGIDYVAKSAPDGYSLVWVASDGISILPALRANVPYKVPDDFEFICRIVIMPNMVAVYPTLPIHSMAELIAYAKSKRVRYGTGGVGSAPHLGTVMLEGAAGIKMTHVPYSGVGPAITDLIGGHIDIALFTPQTMKPYSDSGKIRVIATTGQTRHPLYPDIPTLAEVGLPAASMVVWYGILAPKGTPQPVLTLLRTQMADIMKDQAVLSRLSGLGYQPAYLDGDEFRKYVIADLEQWRGVAQGAGIKLLD